MSAFRRKCFPFICEACVRENNSAVSICAAGDLPSWFGRLRVSNFISVFCEVQLKSSVPVCS